MVNLNFVRLYLKKHMFRIVVSLSIAFILITGLMNLTSSNQGSWNNTYTYVPERIRKSIPTESKGEAECRRVLEMTFQRPFPKQRPLFLMNSVTNKPLEIDCCNIDMQLGVEYNGKQHYEYVPSMHTTKDSFRTQQYRDEMKYRLCKENNFDLIVVPYTVPLNEIEPYLKRELTFRRYI